MGLTVRFEVEAKKVRDSVPPDENAGHCPPVVIKTNRPWQN